MPRYTTLHEERDHDRVITVAVTEQGQVRLEMGSPTIGRCIAVMSETEAERIGFAMIEAAGSVKAMSYLPASEFELVYDESGDVIGVRLV
jgi:hypothetical protein